MQYTDDRHTLQLVLVPGGQQPIFRLKLGLILTNSVPVFESLWEGFWIWDFIHWGEVLLTNSLVLAVRRICK